MQDHPYILKQTFPAPVLSLRTQDYESGAGILLNIHVLVAAVLDILANAMQFDCIEGRMCR